MNDDSGAGRKFSNRRIWREYISAVQSSVIYPCAEAHPKLVYALRSGGAWFTEVAARTPRWLA